MVCKIDHLFGLVSCQKITVLSFSFYCFFQHFYTIAELLVRLQDLKTVMTATRNEATSTQTAAVAILVLVSLMVQIECIEVSFKKLRQWQSIFRMLGYFACDMACQLSFIHNAMRLFNCGENSPIFKDTFLLFGEHTVGTIVCPKGVCGHFFYRVCDV